MSKFWDITFGVVLFIISILILLYTMLIASDGPVDISKNEFVISIISLLFFGVVYSFYAIKSKVRIMVLLQLISFAFWVPKMIAALMYNYQYYDTVISVVGCTITAYCIALSIYKLVITRKNKTP